MPLLITSSARPISCTQDLVQGNDAVADTNGSSSSTQRCKRKLDNDNIGAFSN